jgi:hypothetical protein
MKTFNINGKVKVRFTDNGKELLRYLDGFSHRPLIEDENGYAEVQMWELMSKFGPFLGAGKGGNPYFSNDILIDERGLEQTE